MNQNSKLKDSDFSTGSVSYEPKINPVYALDAEKMGIGVYRDYYQVGYLYIL